MRSGVPRDRAFRVALVISGMVHLSMVSVFSIMIWLPRQDVKYFSFILVNQPPAQQVAEAPSRPGVLRVRSAEELLGGRNRSNADDALSDQWAALPPIDLPRVESAPFDRLRTLNESLKIGSQFRELFYAEPKDSWALFNEELQGFGQRLRRRLTGTEAPAPAPRPVRVSTPAPGFGIYVQWMGSPYDRQLLFAPPIQVLWELDAVEVGLPITLVFTVNPQGKVTEIQVPVEDEKGLSSAVGTALLKYKFAPLREGDKDQHGTLLVAPESRSGSAEMGVP